MTPSFENVPFPAASPFFQSQRGTNAQSPTSLPQLGFETAAAKQKKSFFPKLPTLLRVRKADLRSIVLSLGSEPEAGEENRGDASGSPWQRREEAGQGTKEEPGSDCQKQR